MNDVDPLSQQAFWAAVTRNGRAGCLVCQLDGKDHGLVPPLRCSGQKQAHHVPPFTKAKLRGVHSPIPKQALMLLGTPEIASPDDELEYEEWNPQDLAVADPRIGIPVRWIHHESLESGAVKLHAVDLRRAADNPRLTFDPVDFARDWGLEHWLPDGLL